MSPRIGAYPALADHELPAVVCADGDVLAVSATQAHGMLIALHEPSLVVRAISANVASFFARAVDDIVGRSVEALLGARQMRLLQARVAAADLVLANPFRLSLGEPAQAMECVAHRRGGALILEFEPLSGAYSLTPLGVAAHIQTPLARLAAATTIDSLTGVAASEMRRLSGFERVIVVRFDREWNGEVIGEARDPTAFAYVGYRFPARDIPTHVRAVATSTTLRVTVEVGSLPVPILPEQDAASGAPLDLAQSILCSGDPAYLARLGALGVMATMTASVVVGENLWGLIVCYHRTPYRLDYATRSVCAFIARGLAAELLTRADRAALQARLDSHDVMEAYMTDREDIGYADGDDPLETVRLLGLFDADGVVSHTNGVRRCFGTTVCEVELASAVAKLQMLAVRGIASSSMLSALDCSADAYAQSASGALYLGLSDRSDDYVLLLRQGIVSSAAWPTHANAAERPAEGAPHPHTSFDAWRATVHGRSRPWTQLELDNARLLREQLVKLQQKDQFELLAENSGDVICRIGPDLVARYVSPSASWLFGRSPTAMVGSAMNTWVAAQDLPAIAADVARLYSGERDVVTTPYRILRDGTPLWVEGKARIFHDPLTGEAGDMVLVMRDISERRELEQELFAIARTDALTGLSNRRAFDETFEREWRRARRDGTALSLLLLDLDRFKAYNDRYGHQAGDDCLRAVAAALRSVIRRPGDCAARYGGEELGVILPNTAAAGASDVAERVRLAIEGLHLPHAGNAECGGWVTASIGAATAPARVEPRALPPPDAPSLEREALLAAADRALYAAKDGGRNRVVGAPLI